MLLLNGSGGTDVCSAIVTGTPCRPSTRARSPAAAWASTPTAFDVDGNEVVGELGRARDHRADAVDAGALLERPGRRALPRRRTSTSTRRLAPGRLGALHRARAAASSPAARTRRSTAAACAWARASSTPSSRSCPRSPTAWSCTSRTPRADRASSRCSSCWPSGSTRRCARASPARCRALAAPRARHDRRRAGHPATLTGIALVIAWAFEATPQGIKRTSVADAERDYSRGKVWIYLVIVGVLFSISLFFLGRYTARNASSRQDVSPARTEVAKAISPKSIAVMPLLNESGDPADEYFSDGLSEELIAALGQVRNLKVIGAQFFFSFQRQERGTQNDRREVGCEHAPGRDCTKTGKQGANCCRTD